MMKHTQFCKKLRRDPSGPLGMLTICLNQGYDKNIDVGPAMIAKILTENGQVLHRSTYQP